jgi:hypothetical protein
VVVAVSVELMVSVSVTVVGSSLAVVTVWYSVVVPVTNAVVVVGNSTVVVLVFVDVAVVVPVWVTVRVLDWVVVPVVVLVLVVVTNWQTGTAREWVNHSGTESPEDASTTLTMYAGEPGTGTKAENTYGALVESSNLAVARRPVSLKSFWGSCER